MTTLELLQYYSSLLILQYVSKPKAVSTVLASVRGYIMAQISTQQIAYSATPTGGSYILSYQGNSTVDISFDATDADIQDALQALPGLEEATVSNLLVTFTGVTPPAFMLIVDSSTLVASGKSVRVTVIETDLTLPLAILNGYNLIGPNTAVGVQLDVLGKYAGVTRTGIGITGSITLNDSDFLILIKFAIVQNNSGSDLSTIVNNLFQFFGTNVLVFDYQNMHMSYLISSSLGSQNLIQLLITENLLPAPMTVQVSVIYAPNVNNFFGFVSYQRPVAVNNSPFNTYENYQTDWPWLDYFDGIFILTSLLTESGDIIIQENGDALYID